jgi:hypothetical protein
VVSVLGWPACCSCHHALNSIAEVSPCLRIKSSTIVVVAWIHAFRVAVVVVVPRLDPRIDSAIRSVCVSRIGSLVVASLPRFWVCLLLRIACLALFPVDYSKDAPLHELVQLSFA